MTNKICRVLRDYALFPDSGADAKTAQTPSEENIDTLLSTAMAGKSDSYLRDMAQRPRDTAQMP